MNIVGRIVLTAGLACGTVSSHAAYQGTVTNVTPYYGKVWIIVGDGAFVGTSACPAGSSMIYWIDPSTPFGRSMVAVATAAKLSGRYVWTAGDGTCIGGSPYGNGEGLVGIDLKG